MALRQKRVDLDGILERNSWLLEVSKARLGGDPAHGWEWDWMSFQVPSKPFHALAKPGVPARDSAGRTCGNQTELWIFLEMDGEEEEKGGDPLQGRIEKQRGD